MRILWPVLLVAATANAQEPEPAPEPVPAPAVTPAAAVAEDEPVIERGSFRLFVDGFLRLKGQIVQSDPSVPFVGRNDGFVLQNARLGVTGRWREQVLVRLSAEGALDEREGRNDVEGTLRFSLKDAYADLRFAPAFELRGGRFEALWDVDEFLGETERAFIDRAVAARGVLPTQGFETPGLRIGRSLGVALRSETATPAAGGYLGYEVAVQNGNGELEAQNDNDRVAISAAGLLQTRHGGLLVAARWNPRTEGDLPLQQTEEDFEGAAGGWFRMGPVALAAQVLFRHTRFATTGGPAENALGGHAQASFPLELGCVTLAPGYRFAFYEPSDLIAADRVQEHTLGVTLKTRYWPVRLQLEVTHVIEQDGRALDNSRLEALFEVRL